MQYELIVIGSGPAGEKAAATAAALGHKVAMVEKDSAYLAHKPADRRPAGPRVEAPEVADSVSGGVVEGVDVEVVADRVEVPTGCVVLVHQWGIVVLMALLNRMTVVLMAPLVRFFVSCFGYL